MNMDHDIALIVFWFVLGDLIYSHAMFVFIASRLSTSKI